MPTAGIPLSGGWHCPGPASPELNPEPAGCFLSCRLSGCLAFVSYVIWALWFNASRRYSQGRRVRLGFVCAVRMLRGPGLHRQPLVLAFLRRRAIFETPSLRLSPMSFDGVLQGAHPSPVLCCSTKSHRVTLLRVQELNLLGSCLVSYPCPGQSMEFNQML